MFILKKWHLKNGFFLLFLQPNSNPGVEDVTITDEKDPETASQTGSLASERGIDIGRVGSWAIDFEKLLTDPIGLRTFAVSFAYSVDCCCLSKLSPNHIWSFGWF